MNLNNLEISATMLKRLASRATTPAQILVWALIAKLAKRQGFCYAANARLAEVVGCSVRQVQVHISALIEQGVVVNCGSDGRRRRLSTPEIMADADMQKTTPPTCNKQHVALTERERLEEKNSCPAGAGPSGFGFESSKKTNTTDDDITNATKLYQAAAAHLGASHPLLRKHDITKWAAHFSKLRTIDEVSQEQVDGVLAWYIENIGGTFVPQAYSGEAFRKKFMRIAIQANAAGATTEISELANNIANHLAAQYTWPGDSDKRLPAAVQLSLDHYVEWRGGLRDVVTTQPHTKPGVLAEHLYAKLGRPEEFIKQWFVDIHVRVTGWAEWRGDFALFLFGAGATSFTQRGRAVATACMGNPTVFDKLCEIIDANQ